MRPAIRLIALTLALCGAGAAIAQGSGRSAAQRGEAFDRADANHDGYLTPEEFMATPRAQPPNNPILNWLATDKNKDGLVSREEFVTPMTGEDPSGPAQAAPPAPPAATRPQ